MVEKSSFIFGKRVVGTAGFELVAHPREKLWWPTTGLQAKKGLFQRRFILILLIQPIIISYKLIVI